MTWVFVQRKLLPKQAFFVRIGYLVPFAEKMEFDLAEFAFCEVPDRIGQSLNMKHGDDVMFIAF